MATEKILIEAIVLLEIARLFACLFGGLCGFSFVCLVVWFGWLVGWLFVCLFV